MSYFPFFLICISQYFLQGTNANDPGQQLQDLLDLGEKLNEESKMFKKMGERKKRDFYDTFGHDSWQRQPLGQKYNNVREKLSGIYGTGERTKNLGVLI
ncbi:Hypothetical protein SRAE_0000078000 [Strongyloides ratti]|uniref:Uncharacterized protein n=1 Tax=Strongyloides ratti TaxID=34506 RepID=A0A090KW77_STRRB|nr:Hypothetical protein SRAE_0000078000 [Strongyloides ratti]CEF61666.1 Hypothetical protein SRAE_0000078000 [Strongyloides ratti]